MRVQEYTEFMLERITIQWLAGFFDGEGGVSIYKSAQGWRSKATLTQNDKSLLEAIKVRFPEFHFDGPRRKWGLKLDGTHKQGYEITVHGSLYLSVLLEALKPLVIRKLMEVEVGLEFCSRVAKHEKGKKRYKLAATENSIRMDLAEKMRAARKSDSIVVN